MAAWRCGASMIRGDGFGQVYKLRGGHDWLPRLLRPAASTQLNAW
jgi:hypothetical protein